MPSSGNYICFKCGRSMKPEKNGAQVIECTDKGLENPYKIWDSDIWKCPDCGFMIVTGFPSRPLYEHFQEDFQKRLDEIENDPKGQSFSIRFY